MIPLYFTIRSLLSPFLLGSSFVLFPFVDFTGIKRTVILKVLGH